MKGIVILILFFVSIQFVNAQKILLKNCKVVDVLSGKINKNKDIIIDKGTIKDIVSKGTKLTLKFDKIVDLKGKWVVPGYVEAHYHLGRPSEARELRRKSFEKLMHYFVKNGITSVREMGGDARLFIEYKRAAANGELNIPDIYYSAFVAGEKYYASGRDKRNVKGLDSDYAPWQLRIDDNSNMDSLVLLAKGIGASGMKTYANITAETLKKLIASANKYKMPIWSHATIFSAKPSDIAQKGVLTMSHAHMLRWEQIKKLYPTMFKNWGEYISTLKPEELDLSKFFSQMKSNGVMLDATAHLAHVNKMKEGLLFTKQAIKAGVELCVGTDWVDEPEKKKIPYLFDELKLYVDKCGMDLKQALKSLTYNGAKACGVSNLKGTVDKNKQADLVVLNSNPYEKLSNLNDVYMVLKKGKIIKGE